MCGSELAGRLAGVAASHLLCLLHEIKDNFCLDLLMETVRIAVNTLPSFYRRCSYSLVWQNIKKHVENVIHLPILFIKEVVAK